MENINHEEMPVLYTELQSKSFFTKSILIFLGILIFIISGYFLLFRVPSNFPVGGIFSIGDGASLHSISLKLKNEHFIRSRVVFKILVIMDGGEKRIISADYLFENKISVFEIARRIVKGERHLAPVKITIPEGFNISDIANLVSSKLPNFDKNKFILATKDKEGYLFPDTYFFFTTADEEDVLKSLSSNFEKKIKPILADIVAYGKTEKEIIIMASIIEKEAKGDQDRALISGILWRRLKIGMPLQVDAALETYKVRGLPQAPICNPGLEAIKAAIYPQSSPYLYYLHDKMGGIHFAKTFAEHKLNKFKYLK